MGIKNITPLVISLNMVWKKKIEIMLSKLLTR